MASTLGEIRADTLQKLEKAVADYLNAGGPSDAIRGMFEKAGILGDARQVDLSGDDLPEVIVAADIGGANRDQPEGTAVWLYECRSGRYVVTPIASDGLMYEPFFGEVSDLNGDGRLDALVGGYFESFNGDCELLLYAIAWDGSSYTNLFGLSGAYTGVKCPAKLEIRPNVDDGSREIVATGTTSVTMAGGLGRAVTKTYDLVDGQYALKTSDLGPSNYRIHVVQDAHQAYLAGDYALAGDLYRKAATDETLIDYMVDDQNDLRKQYLSAYALYQLVFVAISEADSTAAKAAQEELSAAYPSEKPGTEFIVLATMVMDGIKRGTEHSTICDEVIDKAVADYSNMFSEFEYGEANAGIIDFCPLQR
ncbi:MAG TPA: hypothetical protein PLC98_24975 [Anaerolineales bacterium]|nr:hypothetical protein [Anaerolineales bacterium]